MNKIKLYFTLILIAIALFSCVKDKVVEIPPPREFAVQYAADKDSIELYLKSHYLSPTTVDGFPDVTFTKIPTGGTQTKVWDNTTYPLQHIIVKNDSRKSLFADGAIEDATQYKLYYIVLQEGGGVNPTDIDSTYTSYKGWTFNNKSFDSNNVPIWSTYPSLSAAETGLISGYRQILKKIKSPSSATQNPDGTINYSNPGIVVVFIPSALGYFNVTRGGIPAYSCIAFRIRLHALRERDHDRDGIKSKHEDISNDTNYFNDDTDADNTPDFLDIDDDGDKFLTKFEIKNPAGGYFTFANIPLCTGGNNKKRYLDPKCSE